LLKRTLIPIVLIAALAAFAFWGPHSPAEPVVRQQLLMGTVVEITAWGDDRRTVESAVQAALAEMARIERLMGPGEGSDAVRLSRAADGAEVAPETAAVIALALRAAEVSGGAFDVTLGRLKDVWAVESERPRVPAPEAIREGRCSSTAFGSANATRRWRSTSAVSPKGTPSTGRLRSCARGVWPPPR
jgi:thiamine biosynthesis lipoprotein